MLDFIFKILYLRGYHVSCQHCYLGPHPGAPVFSPVPIAHDDDGVVLVLGGVGVGESNGVLENTQGECLPTELVCSCSCGTLQKPWSHP